jgi:hypothetical protein
MTFVVLAGLAMAVLLVSVATAGEVHLWHAGPAGSPEPQTPVPTTSPPATVPLPAERSSSDELPAWIAVVVQVIAVLCLIGLAVVVIRTAWRHRPSLAWRKRAVATDFEVLPDIAESMSADAAEQRAALLRGSPRNAIVECWLRLESVVADAGLQRDPAATPTEFTERVMASYAVDPTAIRALSALYREARFSTHVMGEAERTTAVAALDALHEGFRRRLEPTAVVAG